MSEIITSLEPNELFTHLFRTRLWSQKDARKLNKQRQKDRTNDTTPRETEWEKKKLYLYMSNGKKKPSKIKTEYHMVNASTNQVSNSHDDAVHMNMYGRCFFLNIQFNFFHLNSPGRLRRLKAMKGSRDVYVLTYINRTSFEFVLFIAVTSKRLRDH